MLGFTYWLLKPSSEDEKQKYLIYFDESVLGLNVDASVKYRGVGVGKVVKLSINQKNSQKVEVLISVLKTTPIKSSTVAKLNSHGITGLSYINLSFDDSNAEPLEAKEGEDYPVIKTIPSLFNQLESSFGNFSDNLSTTLMKTQELLDGENQIQVSLLLKNSAKFMDKMNLLLDDKTINDFQSAMKNLNSSTKKLDEIMPRIDIFLENSVEWENKISGSFHSIKNSYIGIQDSMDVFKKAVSSGDFNLKEITSDVVPTMNNTFLSMQQLIVKIEEAINQYERSPGDMIFTQEKIKKGPGED
ncbi:MCE family protein [Candidatus Sulfurimonas marisnigri]|uniref:MCE family protein n=2 Tax=Candidatus Sulfurimonas marisnigri TaxID=2740405 RepID=A0A7S7M3C1_9BACT|nr:MCE family protein [Candidatus Sulfurimonas marisnigri]